jgi:hypothetical protein
MNTDESATQPQPTSTLDRDELERMAERYRLFLSRTGEGIARFELREPVDVTLGVEPHRRAGTRVPTHRAG